MNTSIHAYTHVRMPIYIYIGVPLYPRLSVYIYRCGYSYTFTYVGYALYFYLWAAAIVNWAAHMLRNTGNACWSANLLHVKSTHELDELRACSSSKRPGTRLTAGFMCRRWTDSVAAACDFISSFKIVRRPYANNSRKLSFSRSERVICTAKCSIDFINSSSLSSRL